MKADLQARVVNDTWHEIKFFQLRSLSLPDQFEYEIQNTEVKGQDILKAENEKKREQVKFDTNVEIARLAVNATLEKSYGEANRTVYEAKAVESTIKDVVTKQALSYKKMKKDLKFGTNEILGYLQANLIKDYKDGKIAIQLKDSPYTNPDAVQTLSN